MGMLDGIDFAKRRMKKIINPDGTESIVDLGERPPLPAGSEARIAGVAGLPPVLAGPIQAENQQVRTAGLQGMERAAGVALDDAQIADAQNLNVLKGQTLAAETEAARVRGIADAPATGAGLTPLGVAGNEEAHRRAMAEANPSKAADAAVALLGPTGNDLTWKPETMKTTSERTAIASLMSQGQTYEQAREAVAGLSRAGQMGGIMPATAGAPHGAGGTWVGRGAVKVDPVATQPFVAPSGNVIQGPAQAKVTGVGPDLLTQTRLAEGPKLRVAEGEAALLGTAAKGSMATSAAEQAKADIRETAARTAIQEKIGGLPPAEFAALMGGGQAGQQRPMTQQELNYLLGQSGPEAAKQLTALATATEASDPELAKTLRTAAAGALNQRPVYEELPEDTIEILSRKLGGWLSGGKAGGPPRKIVGYEPAVLPAALGGSPLAAATPTPAATPVPAPAAGSSAAALMSSPNAPAQTPSPSPVMEDPAVSSAAALMGSPAAARPAAAGVTQPGRAYGMPVSAAGGGRQAVKQAGMRRATDENLVRLAARYPRDPLVVAEVRRRRGTGNPGAPGGRPAMQGAGALFA
jgi:hypothetical protein